MLGQQGKTSQFLAVDSSFSLTTTIFPSSSSILLLYLQDTIMNTDNVQNSNNHDPIQALPNETFASLFSHLPISSTAISSAVSKQWRQLILSTPTLHSELDLTKFSGEDDLAPIFYHLPRLCQLSQNRFVKMDLNLTAFFTDLQGDQSDHIPDQNPTKSMHYLYQYLSASKQSLKSLTVSFTKPRYQLSLQEEILEDSVIFVLHLLLRLQHFPALKFLEFIGPLPISLRTGGIGSDRRLTISSRDYSHEGMEAWTISYLLQLTEKFPGGVTEFTLEKGRNYPCLEEWFSELENQEQSLVKLDWISTDKCGPLLNFAMRCSRLESLRLRLEDCIEETEDEWDEWLTVPEEALMGSNLKRLEIENRMVHQDARFDWLSLSKWMAVTRLEKLILNLDSRGQGGLRFNDPFAAFLLQSRESLKVLDLTELECTDLKAFNSDPQSSMFPNLESLAIFGGDLSIFDFFSYTTSPKLTTLSLGHDLGRGNVEEIFLRILQNCHSNLIILKISMSPANLTKDLPQIKEPLIFSRLDRLSIIDPFCATWLSTSQFPQLVSLMIYGGFYGEDRSQEMWSNFRRNAPKMDEIFLKK